MGNLNRIGGPFQGQFSPRQEKISEGGEGEIDSPIIEDSDWTKYDGRSDVHGL